MMSYAVYDGTRDVVCPEEPTEEKPDQDQQLEEEDNGLYSVYLVYRSK